MVAKEIVEKIIRDNDLLPPREGITLGDINLKDMAWSKEKNDLKDYIAALPFEDVVDIISLMEYGRDCYNMQRQGTEDDFIKIRKNSVHANSDPSERGHLAVYLLKIKQLSSYLRWALHLYDEVEYLCW